MNNFFDKGLRALAMGAVLTTFVDADLSIDRFIYIRYNQAF